MTTLREEHNKKKLQKEEIVKEAAVKWVLENVILLDEGFNRDALMRLQTSISKFDAMFAPFGVKVPEVKRSLDSAIDIMNRLTMGEKITRSDGRLRLTKEEAEAIKEPATYMVKYMSILYNNLSRFFNKDMPILLEFPIFGQAAQNPGVPLRDLADAERMRKAILHALMPSQEVIGLLKRMYRSMELPALDYETIADEMLNLTANDFKELTHVEKVPLVATPQSSGPQEAANSTNPKDSEGLLSEDEAILKEFGEINVEQMKQISDGIKKISGIISAFPELSDTNNALKQLQSQALAAAGSNWQLGNNTKNIAATANMVYTFFDKLGDLGPAIAPLIPTDRPLTEQEMASIESILKKAQGGIMSRITNWFKGKLVNPALAPSNIANQIMLTVRTGQEVPERAIAAGQSLKNFFDRLVALKLPTVNPAAPANPTPSPTPTQGTASSTTPAPSGNPGMAGVATPSVATSNSRTPGQANVQGAPVDAKAIASAMDSTIGGNNLQFTNTIQKLISAGWQFVPPNR